MEGESGSECGRDTNLGRARLGPRSSHVLELRRGSILGTRALDELLDVLIDDCKLT